MKTKALNAFLILTVLLIALTGNVAASGLADNDKCTPWPECKEKADKPEGGPTNPVAQAASGKVTEAPKADLTENLTLAFTPSGNPLPANASLNAVFVQQADKPKNENAQNRHWAHIGPANGVACDPEKPGLSWLKNRHCGVFIDPLEPQITLLLIPEDGELEIVDPDIEDLEIVDELDGEDEDNNQAPVCSFVYSTDDNYVTFTSTSYDPDPKGYIRPNKYNWDFGDNSEGKGKVAQNRYADGRFYVTLTVVDNKDAVVTCSDWVNVPETRDPGEPGEPERPGNPKINPLLGDTCNSDNCLPCWVEAALPWLALFAILVLIALLATLLTRILIALIKLFGKIIAVLIAALLIVYLCSLPLLALWIIFQ